ncbi:MAG: MaoC family dehydratase [Oscillospiraceae bacterium]|nr:MaoC family dehydratase [Oscillospiraceae bacterium]
MNAYAIGDLAPGVSESFTVEVTAEMLERFRELSGDVNPLHCDEEFARSRGYKGRVAYGMLAASLYSTLAGVYLPGRDCLLHEVDVKFKKPVFIGDTLTVTGVVRDVSAALGRVEIEGKTVNQDGVTVNKAVIQAGVLAR